ncbi:LLM class flavin-dependent oxidoreductase [Ramlibacter sp. AW1]|uniref:LLM class flavin-dependent oxidoreductase n=1 Tax=Ramlibacter aurantiacus TaxID=2801330 RepID=A0A936ZRX3_9BURK|nr:LLM class flavin-dependent oxidoreductase [Ramlibacter aurantiacus]MBL0422358.1 LLM class flavin-dependent oxidoreductase [Ramlibacter aurantiacus]
MQLDLGVIDHLDRQDRPVHETYESRLELMKLYDRAGFSTFHLTEHHFTPLGLAPSPMVFLSAAASITQRIRLAPLVLILPLYHPLRLAGEICMLDQISKGRLDIGLGRGISPYELAYFNVNHLESAAIHREALEVVKMALTQPVVNFRGDYFKFFNVPMQLKPYQAGMPAMWYPTGVPDSAELAGSQGWHTCFLVPDERARLLAGRYRQGWDRRQAEHPGEPLPKIGITRFIYVAETDAEARRVGMEGYRVWYEKFGYLWSRFDPRPQAPFDPEQQMASGTLIFGSPATVRERIEQSVTATGANYFVTRFAYGNLTHAQSAASLQAFTEEVMPHFATAPQEPRP